MAEMQTYLPFAERWLKDNYGTEYSRRQAESLAYLLAGCAADGENVADRCKKAAESQHAADLREIERLRKMVGELVGIVETVDFEGDAPNNDDMNRWHDAALTPQEEKR